MWSIYDTLILVTGLLTVGIAVIPIATIEKKTRVTAVAVGGGTILLSLFVGSLQSFQYPALVVIAPVIPLVVAGAIIKHAKDLQRFHESQEPPVADNPNATDSDPEPSSAPDPREDAWVALFNRETPANRLAEIAARHPEFAPQIAAHPNCYPELRAWAALTSGDVER
jgi:hypothetical protein